MNADIPNETLTLPDGKETTYHKLLVIDDQNLSKEFSEHAAWLGYIGVLTARAEYEYEAAKLDVETMEAEKDAQARMEFNRKNVKYTEAMVKGYIALDSDYIDTVGLKLLKLSEYKTLRALEAAIKEKGSMLISLGATMRQEMNVTNLVSRIRRE